MTAAEQLTDPAHGDMLSTSQDALKFVPFEQHPVVMLPWSSLRRSEFNPRRSLDDKPLSELAIDIYHKGVLQNLVARPHPREEGMYELAAGERRHRAVELLVEGLDLVDEHGGESTVLKVGADYRVPVRVQPMTDLELLEVATTENLQREDMTPLDEADAFARLAALGMSPGDLAARFGYGVKTVQQRLVLAAGLGKDGRKLLGDGTITLAQAQVIAQTSGELKKHLLRAVREQPGYYTAEQLRRLTVEDRLLVANALFDVAAAGLAVVEDLWGVTPSYFRDGAAALALQLEAIEARAARDREGGEWAFVDVVPCGRHANVRSLPWDTYRAYGPEELRGVVYTHGPAGDVWRHEGVVREADARNASRAAQAAQRARERAGRGPRETAVRDAAHLAGQHARARALWSRLAQDHKRCLALTVQGFFEVAGEVTVKTAPAPQIEGEALPEVQELVARWTTRLPEVFESHRPGTMVAVKRGAELHDALMELELEGLLELLAFCTHDQLHHWGSVTERPGALAVHVARATGADEALARQWEVGADFLNAHTTAQLGALIGEMPARLRPAVGPGTTKKEIVGRVLERRAALREARFVPKLVQFGR